MIEVALCSVFETLEGDISRFIHFDFYYWLPPEGV
jgi:hypothetical protein